MPLGRVSLIISLLLVPVLPVFGQVLEVGTPIPGMLEPDSKRTYSFESGADYFVFGHVDQISVDVVVRILDEEGKELASFDGPARGPEAFQLSPDKAGVFTLEVTPFEGGEGEYVVLLIANEPKATDPNELVDQLMKPFSAQNAPGAVVSVLKEGNVVLAKGYGMANLTYGIPMTPETGVSIASVSKHFTGMAILLLEQDGKLTLDDDVRKHIPELKDFGTPVTIRMMLNHTTGYREVLNFLPMMGWQFTDAMTREVPLRIVQNQPELQNAPGSEYNYNNTTFMLLATLVERVSGEDFDDFMQARIFEPLGMTSTRIKTHQGQVIPGSAQGYTSAEGGEYRYVTDFASAYGASGVNTTARDITKWMLNFRDKAVGGPEAIAKLTTRGILTSGDTTGYALGLGVRTWRGQQLYTHTGGETSFSTYFGYFPEIESGVFLSSNHPSFALGMWSEIAEAFFGEHLESVEEEEETEETPVAQGPSPEQLDAISGTWRFIGAPLMIEYSVEEGELFAQATNQPKFKVTPTSDSTFTFVGVPASVTFHFEADGALTRATHHQGPDSPMEKVVAPEITAEELAAFEGRYYSEELETFYTLKVEDGKLMAHHRFTEPFSISHVVDDEFGAGAWYMGSMKFHRDPDGRVSGFTAGSGRTRGVWFRRW